MLLVPAMPAQAATLVEAVHQGLVRNPEVKSAMAKVGQSTTEVDIAKGGYYPALEASVGPTHGLAGSLGYEVTARQMLYDWGKVRSQVDNASAAERQDMASLAVTREDAALKISEVYLDAIAARQRIEAVRAQISRLEELQKQSQQRVDAGYSDRSEVGRVGLELARTHEQLATEQGNWRDALQQYEVLVGDTAAVLEEPALLILPGHLADATGLEQTITASPLYIREKEKVAAEEAKVHEADAAVLPQLNLEGSALRREIGGQVLEDNLIALRLRMDTYQGLSNFKRKTAARQRLEAAQWSMDTMQRDIRRKVQSLFENETALKGREQSLGEQVNHAREVGALYQEQFFVSLRNMTELLNVYQERLEAERQFIFVKVERKRTQLRAAAQLGLLIPLLEGHLPDATKPVAATP